MDEDWAIERLERWIELALAARDREQYSSGGYRYYTFVDIHNAKLLELRPHHDQVRQIVQRTLGLESLPDLLPAVDADMVELMSGVGLCQEAVARLRTGAETRAKLGSGAPTMAADQLHPNVWNEAARRWNAGNYSDAVQRAATYLNANVQDLLQRHDVSDSELMREAFSSSAPTPGKPRLRWPGDDDNLSVKAMRTGMLNYAQGLFSAVRNLATHSVAELPQQVALEQLAALSVLARWIDECEVVRNNP